MTSLILVDVDGVLNPSTPSPDYVKHNISVYETTYSVHLNPAHGWWLKDLAAKTDSQLVWCTYWEKNAPKSIAPVLGLPEMPVIPMKLWKMGCSLGAEKAYSAMQYVGIDTKFAYFDDEWDINAFLGKNGKHIWVDPEYGLTEKHIAAAEEYLMR